MVRYFPIPYFTIILAQTTITHFIFLLQYTKLDFETVCLHFGFLKGRSTVTQLLQILDEWTQALETGGRIDVIYTDFEKAFDKVPHKRLLSKLRSYRIDNVQDSISMQADLDQLVEWADKWQMQFNVSKCKIMHVGQKNPRSLYTMRNNGLQIVEV